MTTLPVDAHAHIEVAIAPHELERLGAFVFAVTRSFDEAARATRRRDRTAIWGAGCHPGLVAAVAGFDRRRLATLIEELPFVGEVGLDRRSRAPFDRQAEVLAEILEVVAETPRPVSLHSTGATRAILDALERHPVPAPILHWWRGSERDTERAVELGCFFSFNGHEASAPKTLRVVPLERVLTETDFPHARRYDPAGDRPGAVAAIERVLSAVHGRSVDELRAVMWTTLGRLFATVPRSLLPPLLADAAEAHGEDARCAADASAVSGDEDEAGHGASPVASDKG